MKLYFVIDLTPIYKSRKRFYQYWV